ncbi:hypothetical protein I2501_06810 [Streptacidiphilus sp. NEAU-YB345]|uniref:Uncharacterized protein n=2 Tax=Streptacidiphilus fuscans TaxID=2789292 RepID=A0A931AZL9_9ACTN|nr:hypothetical protein [Streptacidiphilus fuscans]
MHPAATVLLALDENKVTPGILGFLIFAALGAGTWWILKAMNRSLGKVDFVEEPEPAEAAAAASVSTEK